jgi:hypothetical protein
VSQPLGRGERVKLCGWHALNAACGRAASAAVGSPL